MASVALLEKIKKIRAQIDELRYRYHVLNDPEITDTMYEDLMHTLKDLEDEHPELITADSPTQRIAGQPLDKFTKIIHTVPQWSFNDAFSEEDLVDWSERIMNFLAKTDSGRPADLNYVCELKIDGLHMVLTYARGILQTAATRGDGKVGEDVTNNIKTIDSVPLALAEPVDLIVEGEVWLGAEMLKTINVERRRNGEALFANPRNAAAGTIRQLDPNVVRARKLKLTAYDISSINAPATQAEELQTLKHLGFLTATDWRVCGSLSEIMIFYREIFQKRTSFPFWIDGIVVKVNQKKYQDALGFTGKAPRWAIAFKFPAEQGTTRIKEVYVQVGRTGALTPVALMEPVKLAGTTVTHATLHNFEEVRRLGVKVGDMVVVEKAGDVIPKIIRVLDKMRSGEEKKIVEPKFCPFCHASVERREVLDKKQGRSAALFCTNQRCYAKELENLIHFASKDAFNIDGLGEKIVAQLMDAGLIKNAADIFTLTAGDLEPLERFASKSAENLITAIRHAKNITLSRFIYALGIHHVGEETALRLAKYFKNLSKLMVADLPSLQMIEDIGPAVAESIFFWFRNQENVRLVENLLANGVCIQVVESVASPGKLAGVVFVFTGSLRSISRAAAKEKVRVLGGETSESVSSRTGFVVVGDDPGSKYGQAQKLGVKILSEQEFLKIVAV